LAIRARVKVKEAGRSSVFGKRSEPHMVIIARGDDIRHFQIRPWVAALAGSALAAIAIGYLLATTYLVLRDDLIDATTARQARLQQAYEDRISALRAQVDRITSRQMLDQQLMETRVGELLQRQSQLTERHGRLAPVLERTSLERTSPESSSATVALPAIVPPPPQKPDLRASLGEDGFAIRPQDGPQDGPRELAYAGAAPSTFALWSTRDSAAPGESSADRADRVFVAINQSLRAIEAEQLDRINALAENAYETADAIAGALEDAGLTVDAGDKSAMGGPLVPIDNPALFDSKVRELDEALDLLDKVKSKARELPLANPSPGNAISSTFGVRPDPLLGTPAMHAGMDFRAAHGSPVRATAAGTVVKAGWNGGYGRMVEVEHADGFSTRYAHLSKVLVKEGQRLDAGEIVGKVGSSGRSTGPHLHYEVRRDGDALNPVRFLKAGKKVAGFL
jgi:murein DD-endopeptidase MepM/ murein hydrolase activator NlpD